MIGIYKIENLINGKVYIGQSINIEQRWREHRSRPFYNNKESDSIFYRAIRKYGLNSFSFEVIEECEKEQLNEREEYWIQFYNSYDKDLGYNLTKGGQNGKIDCKLSEKQILEIYDLLLNTEQTQIEIANKYGVKQNYISYINQGIYQVQKGYNYPLRPLYFDQKNSHKNRKKNYCKICGEEISLKAQYCLKCYALQKRKTERPSREELKQLIRTKPFTQIGKMFDVTDNAIRKWCDNYHLPRKSTEIKKYTDEEWEKI